MDLFDRYMSEMDADKQMEYAKRLHGLLEKLSLIQQI